MSYLFGRAPARLTWPLVLVVVALPLFVGLPAAQAAAPQRLAVVYVGGLRSTSIGDDLNFWRLGVALEHDGYSLREFAYGPGGSCQPLGRSEGELARYVRSLEGSVDGVILVGHSAGGVIALQMPEIAPDLVASPSPFVRRIVTVDSPFDGVLVGDYVLDSVVQGSCQALGDLYDYSTIPNWPSSLASVASWEQSQGVQIAAVANPEDLALRTTTGQELPGLAVNYVIDVVADNSDGNHSAILRSPAGVAALVPIVTGQERIVVSTAAG